MFANWEDWVISIGHPFLTAFKHMAGRHNQKRHGWRYGRGTGTSGLSQADLARGTSISSRTGRSSGSTKRIVAAQASMRRTPEESERTEYRRRSDLPSPIARHVRPGASESERATARIMAAIRGPAIAPMHHPAPTPAPTPKPPKPAKPASTHIATPAAAGKTALGMEKYWATKNIYLDTDDSYRIMNYGKEVGVKDMTNWITNTFSYKDAETGLEAKINDIKTGSRSITVSGKIYDSSGRKVGTFQRDIDTSVKDVHHSFFALNKEYQSGGFGSRFYQNLERGYIKAKMKTATIHANLDVGGYAWARMGFDFSSSSQLSDFVGRLTSAWSRAYGKSYKGPALKHAWDIAAVTGPDGRKIGKEVMIGSSWYGVKGLLRGNLSLYVGNAYYKSKSKKGAST